MSFRPSYGNSHTFQSFPSAAYDGWKTREPAWGYTEDFKECDTCHITIPVDGPDYCEDCDYEVCPHCGDEIPNGRSGIRDRLSDLCDRCERELSDD